jgi:hypothetical protein
MVIIAVAGSPRAFFKSANAGVIEDGAHRRDTMLDGALKHQSAPGS